ncbi:MAG: UDP-glucose/GDP-mannose dehydrogenase family protein [Candidatus Thorarchaeota archaeon]
MRIMIVGAGYVGLSLGVVLSTKHEIMLRDIDGRTVDKINAGISTIHEDGIENRLKSAVSDGRLRACNAMNESGSRDVVFICVGTPSNNDGSVNLSSVESAVDDVLETLPSLIDDYITIAIKSTVPPGTTRRALLDRISSTPYSKKVGVAFNPEFLREGTAIQDALNPDRIVIGTEDNRAFQTLRDMYAVIVHNKPEYVQTSMESAELCKYVANSFLATKISFANEWANLCERIPNADIDEVMKAVSLDSRISGDFFGAGVGYGGSCFPKDVEGAIRFAESISEDVSILRATEKVNASRPKRLLSILRNEVPDLKNKKIAVLGLAFKPGTDDTRTSPTLRVLELLRQTNARICIHDPLVNRMPTEGLCPSDIILTDNIETCMQNVDACILVTAWDIYKEMGLERLTESMNNKVFIDGRRVFVEEEPPKDVIYRTIGTHF